MTDTTYIITPILEWIKTNWLLLTIVLGIVLAFLFLRTTPSNVKNVDELSQLLHDGQPTVFEFYSNF